MKQSNEPISKLSVAACRPRGWGGVLKLALQVDDRRGSCKGGGHCGIRVYYSGFQAGVSINK